MQTASAVAVTAKAVTGNTTEAAAKMIGVKTTTSASATMTAAAGKCVVSAPKTAATKSNLFIRDRIMCPPATSPAEIHSSPFTAPQDVL